LVIAREKKKKVYWKNARLRHWIRERTGDGWNRIVRRRWCRPPKKGSESLGKLTLIDYTHLQGNWSVGRKKKTISGDASSTPSTANGRARTRGESKEGKKKRGDAAQFRQIKAP